MKFDRNIKGNEVKKVNGQYQTHYMMDAEFVHKELNEISPSFCLAKWFTVSLHIPTGRTHSCYHPRAHAIPFEEVAIDVSALHNTKHKKTQRKLMLSGIRPPECEFCWQTEDSGSQLSDRAYRSKDVWEDGIIEEALSIGAEGNANPRYVEVNFNQACNFKCSYCSPHLSTAWMDEIKKEGPYVLADRKHNDITWIQNEMPIDNSPNNPYVTAFWEWLPQIYPTLHTFRMTGGEPLMDKNTFKMFEYVKQHPKEDLHLSITSNCCPPGDQWNKFFWGLKELTDADAIDHFMLFCSLDNIGVQGEYIRNGLDFERLNKNIRMYLKHSQKHSLTFIITFNALSYTGIHSYMEYILSLRNKYNKDRQLVWFDIPQLQDPDYLNPKLIPELVSELERTMKFMILHKEGITNRHKGFKDFEISKVQRLIDWVNSDTGFDQKKGMVNFYKFFTEHDRRRGTDFLKVFPELENFWNRCKDQDV